MEGKSAHLPADPASAFDLGVASVGRAILRLRGRNGEANEGEEGEGRNFHGDTLVWESRRELEDETSVRRHVGLRRSRRQSTRCCPLQRNLARRSSPHSMTTRLSAYGPRRLCSGRSCGSLEGKTGV
jgi:hypothetical protein